MNERIKELAEQAAISCGYFIGPRLYMTHEKEMEKFAELIVRECMNIAYEYDAPKISGPGMIIGNRIEEHFGVRE